MYTRPPRKSRGFTGRVRFGVSKGKIVTELEVRLTTHPWTPPAPGLEETVLSEVYEWVEASEDDINYLIRLGTLKQDNG